MGLLENILKIQSASGQYGEMHKFIYTHLESLQDLTVVTDVKGNISVTKGTPPTNASYPAYACHTDTVHDIRPGYTVARSAKHMWYAYVPTADGRKMQVGIGGDDKCGIYMCLSLLKQLKYMKCVFFVDEEMGCLGSNVFDMSFFDDCRWVIQGDRRGNNDIIAAGMGIDMCSKDFLEDLTSVGRKFGYRRENGSYTDVTTLKRRGLKISAVNISVGYWQPHSTKEIIVEGDLIRAVQLASDAAEKLMHRYPHSAEVPTIQRYNPPKQETKQLPPAPSAGPGTGARKCKGNGCETTLTALQGYYCGKCSVESFFKYCTNCGIRLLTRMEIAQVKCNRCNANTNKI